MSETTAPPALVTPLDKGVGRVEAPLAAGAAAERGWNLLREEVSLPAAVLSEERIAHNLRWMQRFVREYGVQLAPHGKTTMAPALFRRQLAAGAWGITVATAQQARVAHDHGVPRVLMANQLVGRGNFEIVSGLLRDPGFDFFCLVDSGANADQLGRFFAARGQCVQVLLELGVVGGRTGARDAEQVAAVVDAVARWPAALRLAGVEVYEGVLDEEEGIREFLRRAVAALRDLAREGRFGPGPAILSGAGSAWYDVVAEEFAGATDTGSVEVVLRPGCYLTHDVGIYRAAQEAVRGRNPIARSMGAGLLPALHLWAYVQSVPEPGRAIVALGKRDAAFDAGFPGPAQHYRPGDPAPVPAPAHWRVTRMMDQHAYLDVAPGDDLRVGDILAFDVSHPCLTFDKWRQLLVVDAEYNVTEVVQTFF